MTAKTTMKRKTVVRMGRVSRHHRHGRRHHRRMKFTLCKYKPPSPSTRPATTHRVTRTVNLGGYTEKAWQKLSE